MWEQIRCHLHNALFSAIIVALVLLHGDRPIQAASAKLTLLLPGLLILTDAIRRLYRARTAKSTVAVDQD